MQNVKLSQFWDSLRSSYWFLPSLMAIALITAHTTRFNHLLVLEKHTKNIFQSSINQLSEECDRQQIENQYQVILIALESRK